tara:strand:+ start:594 stop:1421 length:828 start_codon:yes stop_codon:yes gene_type:complete
MKNIKLISEIGINHNGDINIAKKLITESKLSGFDIVKFQKRDIYEVYTKEFLEQFRESPWGKTQLDQKKGLEFDKDEYQEIDQFCKSQNIEWMASAWDLKSVDFVGNFNTEFNKIASAMIANNELLNSVAEQKKHTFISTGMATIDEIENAVNIFSKKNCSFELMHCVSTYPLNPKNANLNVIETLKKKFNCDVGYSSHEAGLVNCFAASALNISSLEKHVTLDRSMYGSDQAASIEPIGMRKLVQGIRTIESALGDGIKKIIPEEELVKKKLRP